MSRSHLSKYILLVSILVTINSNIQGQPLELEELSSAGLLAESGNLLASDDYASAIPYLTEYIKRMEGVNDPRVITLMQSVRLKLGQIGAYLDDSMMAVSYLTEYTENLPCLQPREAWKLLTLNLYDLAEYSKCIDAANYALTNPQPIQLPKNTEKVNYDQLSNDELGGLSARQLKRIERESNKKKLSDRTVQVLEAEKKESDYSIEDLVALNMTLAEAHYAMGQWNDCIRPYKYVIEYESDSDRRGYAILQLINSFIALELYQDAKQSIIELSHTEAKYNIRVNMALMSAATALFNVEEFDSALLLYRMVLPRNELINYQIKRMNQLRREVGLSNVELSFTTNNSNRIITKFGDRLDEFQVSTDGFNSGLPTKPDELLKLEDSISTLVSLPPYENDVTFRCGLTFIQSKRPWEAIEALDYVYEHEADHLIGQSAFAEMMFVYLDPLEEHQIIETRGKEFLSNYNNGLAPRQVAYAMTLSYQKQSFWNDIKNLLPTIERFEESENSSIRRYECELYYMQAVADMVLLNYIEARAGFERVLIDYTGSHQQENAHYWHAMAGLFLKDFNAAYDELKNYEITYPDGNWLPSVVYNSGVAKFGLEEYELAEEIFDRVINEFPGDIVYPDALGLRGDLHASNGNLEEAEFDYREAIRSAHVTRQDSYAVFQLVSMFDLEDRHEETVELLYEYLDRCGDEADVAKATYWIGKTKIKQGLIPEAIEVYKDTILTYGNDIAQDGVDLIITETIKISKRLSDLEREILLNELEIERYDTDDKTLELRLRVLIAKMTDQANELGHQLIEELVDLTVAPPPVLAVICDASLDKQDFSRADELLNLFVTRYETSDFMRSALKLNAYGCYNRGNFDEALDIASEAQALYGTEADLDWSQLLKGLILIEQGSLEEAEKAYRAILTVREWRGSPYAEAMFHLGRISELNGKLSTSFGWYQRTYFQYRAHAKGYWAAEAYLASAAVLGEMGFENDKRNTYRAMLFDRYVNKLSQAEVAREYLGFDEVIEIETKIELGQELVLEEPIGSSLKVNDE